MNVLPWPGALLHRDVAAEQAREVARDRQAEPGAAVLAVRAAVGLAERFEDHLLLLGRNADAGVAHRERDAAPAPLPSTRSVTAPALGELERVREQVLQDLADALRIGLERLGRARRR